MPFAADWTGDGVERLDLFLAWSAFGLRLGFRLVAVLVVSGCLDASRTVVVEHVDHDFADLSLQFGDKFRRRIVAALDAAEFVLPDACEFGAFKQFVANGSDEIDAGLRCHDVFAFAVDVAPFEKSFDDRGACRWASDAVFFHCFTQFVVVDGFAGRLHGSQQCALGVVFRWLGRLLLKRGLMRA